MYSVNILTEQVLKNEFNILYIHIIVCFSTVQWFVDKMRLLLNVHFYSTLLFQYETHILNRNEPLLAHFTVVNYYYYYSSLYYLFNRYIIITQDCLEIRNTLIFVVSLVELTSNE